MPWARRASTRSVRSSIQGCSPRSRSGSIRRPEGAAAIAAARNSVRLNLAGEEPLLYPRRVLEMLPIARDIGFDVSLITNGSRLYPGIMASMAPSISLLGLSVDSPIARSTEETRRIDRGGCQLDIAGLAETVDEGRRRNPLMRVKSTPSSTRPTSRTT